MFKGEIYLARPCKPRCINLQPASVYFKPRGIPMFELEEVTLQMDELEALRLADFEQLYQTEGAEQMNVSRQTFANIVASARQKVADALIHGKALKIQQHDEANIETNAQTTQKEN